MSIDPSKIAIVPDWMVWISIIGPFVGTLIGGLITFSVNHQNIKAQEERHKRDLEAQEKKHRKDLLVQIALEDYKQTWIAVLKNGGTIPPIEAFILHINTLAETILSQKPIEENEYIQLLKKSEALIAAHKKYKHSNGKV